MLKLKAYPAKVKERAAPPEVLEKSGVLGQCADVQLQRWAVVKNIEVCDTVIDFQSMRPLYSWDKSSLSQQKTFLCFLAFLLTFAASVAYCTPLQHPALSAVSAGLWWSACPFQHQDQGPGHPLLCFTKGFSSSKGYL